MCVPGFHTYQGMVGGSLEDRSTIFLQHAYDGQDFIILNKDLFFWMATDNMARITKWAQEANWHELYQKNWLEEHITSLKKFLELREDIYKGQPRITTPFCRIHGFYPPGICMIWLKNGEEIVQEIGKGDILPKGDGSYWTWGSVELDPQSGDLYSCPSSLTAAPPPRHPPAERKPRPVRPPPRAVAPFKSLLRGTNVRKAQAPLLGLRLAARGARGRAARPRNGWRPFAIGARAAYIRRRASGPPPVSDRTWERAAPSSIEGPAADRTRGRLPSPVRLRT
ncbi:LOW QUALITY PROTEIN: major histocompatibility complex class I-related gene protein [Lycaon pictus]